MSHYGNNNNNNNQPRRELKPKPKKKTAWQIEAEEAALEMNARNDVQAILQRIGAYQKPEYAVKVAQELYAQVMKLKEPTPEEDTEEPREDFVDEWKMRAADKW